MKELFLLSLAAASDYGAIDKLHPSIMLSNFSLQFAALPHYMCMS